MIQVIKGCDKYLFFNLSVQKGGLYIQVMNGVPLLYSHSKTGSNCGNVQNRCKSLIYVSLHETSNDQASFVSIHDTILIKFAKKHETLW